MRDAVLVDVSGLRKLARDLRSIDKSLAGELRKALKAGGEIVAADARHRAGYSHRIPASIKVRSSTSGVKVVAGGPAAPDAIVLEHGGEEGSFRHPVFGDRAVWADQQARPFLIPAAKANAEQVAAIAGQAFTRLAAGHGFH